MDTQNPQSQPVDSPGLPGMGAPEPDSPQVPLGLMGMSPSSENTPIGGKSKTSMTVLTLGVILVVGVGTLLAMRQAGTLDSEVDAEQAAAEKKIDQVLKRMNASGALADSPGDVKRLFSDTEQLIALFAEDPSSKQVGLDELKKNPFARAAAESEAVAIVEVDPRKAELEAQRLHEARKQELNAEFEKLSLQSLVSGSNPAAFVSNRLVRPQDQVGSFKVEAIYADSVLLAAEGTTYTLTMDGPGQFKR